MVASWVSSGFTCVAVVFMLVLASCTTPPGPAQSSPQAPVAEFRELPPVGGATEIAQVEPQRSAPASVPASNAGHADSPASLRRDLEKRGALDERIRAVLEFSSDVDLSLALVAGQVLQEKGDAYGATRAYLWAHRMNSADSSAATALEWLLAEPRLEEIQRRFEQGYAAGGMGRAVALRDLYHLHYFLGDLAEVLRGVEVSPQQATDMDLGIALLHYDGQGQWYRATSAAVVIAEHDSLAPEVIAYFQSRGRVLAGLVPALVEDEHPDLALYARAYGLGLLVPSAGEEDNALLCLWVLMRTPGPQDTAERLARQLMDHTETPVVASQAAAAYGLLRARAGDQAGALAAYHKALAVDPSTEGAFQAALALVAAGETDLPELAQLAVTVDRAEREGNYQEAGQSAAAYLGQGGKAPAAWRALFLSMQAGLVAPATVGNLLDRALEAMPADRAGVAARSLVDALPRQASCLEFVWVELERRRVEGRVTPAGEALRVAVQSRFPQSTGRQVTRSPFGDALPGVAGDQGQGMGPASDNVEPVPAGTRSRGKRNR